MNHRGTLRSCRRRDSGSLWLAIFGFFPLPIWELELGTYWVFAGFESEPFSLLNTCLRVHGSWGLVLSEVL